jgi:hypothetical protein
MNGNRYYGVRVEGAKYGVGFGSALAIAISYLPIIRYFGQSSTAFWAGCM